MACRFLNWTDRGETIWQKGSADRWKVARARKPQASQWPTASLRFAEGELALGGQGGATARSNDPFDFEELASPGSSALAWVKGHDQAGGGWGLNRGQNSSAHPLVV